MTLMRTCIMIVLLFQYQQILNAEYLTKRRKKVDCDKERNKNTAYYNPWTPTYLTVVRLSTNSQLPQLQSQDPHMIYIQTKRPYSLYYQPQVVYFNSGHPVHNPPNLLKQDTTTMSTLNRFGDDDDGPVWDTVTGVTGPPFKFIPTRRNKVQGQAITFPPIIRHDATTVRNVETKNSLFRIKSDKMKSAPPDDNTNPSRCVWAIISCCSTTSAISYECFEQLGCEGAFWGSSPCETDFAQAAIANIMNYYQSK